MFVGKKTHMIINFLIGVRLGGVQIKFIPHLAPLVNGSIRVASRHKGHNLSLGFAPGKQPLKILL